MQDKWESFWTSFLNEKQLNNYIESMNEVEHGEIVKDICHDIYDDYEIYSKHLNDIRFQLIQEVENLPGVHLQTSRIKTIESLLEKVIKKRSEGLFDRDSLYKDIEGKNYKDVLTDLIGIRLILSYRGDWLELHNAILEKFPLKEYSEYKDNYFIPHEEGVNFIAEKPCAYYAYGDDISLYSGLFIKCKMKKTGYRSVHYVISYRGVYTELQVRTIYDEAWSDCDHTYVYKKDSNPSHAALLRMSKILCGYTNASNDLGDLMRIIYEDSPIEDMRDKNHFMADQNIISKIDFLIERFSTTQEDLISLRQMMVEKDGGGDE